MRLFLSIGARLVVNVEALNAVETVGNVTKHRRAPVVIPEAGGYKLMYVPAVSGESLANAFQRNLVEAARQIYAKEKVLCPLTPWDERYEFVKFMDRQHLTPALNNIVTSKWQQLAQAKQEFEATAIRESIVADVGGFLYAEEELPVKRTSRIQFGYMLPVYDSIENVAIEAQFHARHVPSEMGEGGQRPAQMIYYVETASAVYGATVNLDIDGVGRTALIKVADVVNNDERKRRVKAALYALAGLFVGEGFGAKLSRFLPVKSVESMVAILSSPVAFTTSPPQYKGYIADTLERLRGLEGLMDKLGLPVSLKAFAYGAEGLEGVIKAKTVEGLFALVTEEVLKEP
ncbi:MAG: type I-A CRISPR-associated protein Cas7/Csa2 [Candidatus Nezhaarchaeota archaeon]|nr:type I-A CRISPR-associated protein Cas7/Csa2 [Candidatus Nezhaarchaeota archaeon]